MQISRHIIHFNFARFCALSKPNRKLDQTPRRSKNWEKSVGVLEELEVKQTVTDAIVPIATGLQAAGLIGSLAAIDGSLPPTTDTSMLRITPSEPTRLNASAPPNPSPVGLTSATAEPKVGGGATLGGNG